jgi:hypothetical protein
VKNTTVYDGSGRTTSISATNTSAAVLGKRAYTFTVNGTKDGALRKTVTDQAGAVTTYTYVRRWFQSGHARGLHAG